MTTPDGLSSSFAPGTWQAQTAGGTDIGPLSFNFAVPPAMHITNVSQLQVLDPNKNTSVSWNGDGAPDGFDAVVSLGPSAVPIIVVGIGGTPLASLTSTGVVCRVPASQGQVTIPAAMVAQAASFPLLSLTLEITERNDSPVVFPFTMRNGGQAIGYFRYRRLEALQFLKSQ